MEEWLNYQTIIQFRINVTNGKVEHLKGFTRPIGGTKKGTVKANPKRLNIGDIEDEVLL